MFFLTLEEVSVDIDEVGLDTYYERLFLWFGFVAEILMGADFICSLLKNRKKKEK